MFIRSNNGSQQGPPAETTTWTGITSAVGSDLQGPGVRAPAQPHSETVVIDHELISTAILPVPLIQGEQLSGPGESNWSTG